MIKRIVALLIILCFAPTNVFAGNIRYVRIDGGVGGVNSQSCNGTQNVPFTGSNGPNCAFNHPNWAIPERNSIDYNDNPTTFAIAGGDTLVIGPGEYRMGYQVNGLNPAHNYTVSGLGGVAYVQGDIKVPSGTAADWTEIYGCSVNGCGGGAKPILWTAGSMNHLFEVTNSSYIHWKDIEITDHSVDIFGQCRSRQDLPGYPSNSLCGKVAFKGLGGWHHLRFSGVDVHGLAERGFFLSGSGPSGTPVDTLWEDSNIDGNSGPALDMDGCGNSGLCGITGSMTFRKTTMRWNGCGEAYPVVQGPGVTGRLPATDACTGQGTGGYGDCLATSDTGGDWLFEDVNISHCTEDAIDLLYMGRTDRANYGSYSLTVRRSLFEGSSGAAIKGPITALEDNIIIGNCAWWAGTVGQIYTPAGYNVCRAQGTPISTVHPTTTAIKLYNNTILSNGDNTVIADSSRQAAGNNGVCNFDTKNNIFIGGYGYQQDAVAMFDRYDGVGNPSCQGGLNRGMSNNICYLAFKSPALYGSCDGTNDQNNVNPLFVGALEQGTGDFQTTGFYNGIEYATRLYLQSGSPARDAATETNAGDGVDFNTFSRGASWDIGALEFGSVPSGGPSPVCGDGVINGSEICDCGGDSVCTASELNNETCVSQGFSGGGTLACAANCLSYTTAGCNSPVCGDGNLDAGEQCDDNNTTNGDGCSSICLIETPPPSGLGTTIPGMTMAGASLQ